MSAATSNTRIPNATHMTLWNTVGGRRRAVVVSGQARHRSLTPI